MQLSLITIITILTIELFPFAESKCAYTQSPDPKGLPYVYDGDAFKINYTMKACVEYIGMDVCCN